MTNTDRLIVDRQTDRQVDRQIVSLLAGLITICTLGICTPWAICVKESWLAKHTIIEGKRLKFIGTGIGLFGNYIKWFLLTIITFGIYSFWLVIKIQQWKVKNTVFA